MNPLSRTLAALTLAGALLTPAASAVSLTLDGQPLPVEDPIVCENTTYVPLRSALEVLEPSAQIAWAADRAVALFPDFTLTACPGSYTIFQDSTPIPLTAPVLLNAGRTLVPIRPLAALLGLEVTWDSQTSTVSLTSPTPAWQEDELYWLSRIISAESQGEPWEGKIAVGNVVLNRVASPDFPDTIYGVIFDDRWGGQFEPVRNGTVYQEPTEESVRAAIACLEGERIVGDSLYFLAPHLTDNHWTMENRTYITTIGAHWFYK